MEINTIYSVLFFVLGALAIASAIITIFHKQPVKSAISLVFHFFMLAGIYLTLAAQFLAVMQIVVYAGAIMVLVIFVIMLLNLSEDAISKRQNLRLLGAVVLGGIFFVFIALFITSDFVIQAPGVLNDANILAENGTVQSIGKELFSNFLIPIEITGILLLSAIIGAVLLAKRRLN